MKNQVIISLLLCGLSLAATACAGEETSRTTEDVVTRPPTDRAAEPKLAMNDWTYVSIDEANQDNESTPDGQNYFGLAIGDVNNDGLADILSGRTLYLQPNSPTGSWEKVDLGRNVDGNIIIYLGAERGTALLGQALPQVYQYLPTDETFENWEESLVATLPAGSSGNGQGCRTAQIIAGGAPEVLYASKGGIYMLEADGMDKWPVSLIGPDASENGFAVADIDGDGDLDLVAGYPVPSSDGVEPTLVVWYENPGDGTEYWNRNEVGNTRFATDRVEMADVDGDKRVDAIVAEARKPGLGPDASLYVFLQRDTGWVRQTVVTQYSMNNLDVGDFDQDGDIDLITAEHSGERLSLQIWENDGEANFKMQEVDRGKESHLGTQTFDIDGDDDLDIISIGGGKSNNVHLWLNEAISTAPD